MTITSSTDTTKTSFDVATKATNLKDWSSLKLTNLFNSINTNETVNSVLNSRPLSSMKAHPIAAGIVVLVALIALGYAIYKKVYTTQTSQERLNKAEDRVDDLRIALKEAELERNLAETEVLNKKTSDKKTTEDVKSGINKKIETLKEEHNKLKDELKELKTFKQTTQRNRERFALIQTQKSQFQDLLAQQESQEKELKKKFPEKNTDE